MRQSKSPPLLFRVVLKAADCTAGGKRKTLHRGIRNVTVPFLTTKLLTTKRLLCCATYEGPVLISDTEGVSFGRLPRASMLERIQLDQDRGPLWDSIGLLAILGRGLVDRHEPSRDRSEAVWRTVKS